MPLPPLFGPTMHLSRCCTPCIKTCRRGDRALHTVAACDSQSSWLPWWRQTALNLHLAPSSFHLELQSHDPFLLLTLTLDVWSVPVGKTTKNTSRPEWPPPTEAPETQRSGRANPSESPVWLAARPAIDRVGQREPSRRQKPDPQESCVRGEAADHRRWEFAQESPLPSVVWLKQRWSEERKREWEKDRMH